MQKKHIINPERFGYKKWHYPNSNRYIIHYVDIDDWKFIVVDTLYGLTLHHCTNGHWVYTSL